MIEAMQNRIMQPKLMEAHWKSCPFFEEKNCGSWYCFANNYEADFEEHDELCDKDCYYMRSFEAELEKLGFKA